LISRLLIASGDPTQAYQTHTSSWQSWILWSLSASERLQARCQFTPVYWVLQYGITRENDNGEQRPGVVCNPLQPVSKLMNLS